MEKQNFAWPVTSMDQADYSAFVRWFEQCADLLKTRQLIIWGAGIRGTTFSILLKERGYRSIRFVDSNPQKHGGYIDKFPIISPDELEVLRKQTDILILVSAENSQDIQSELEVRGYRKNADYFLVESGQYEAYVKEFLRPYGKKTLIMGDCVFSTVSLQETDRATLRDKMFQQLGYDNTKILAMHGVGLRAQYHIFHAQILQDMRPEQLIVMVNFEMLTGKQHLLPRSQHTELLNMLLEVQDEPANDFCDYVQTAKVRSRNLQMEFFTNGEEQVPLTDAKARNYFRLNYLYPLDTQIEGFVYLAKLFELASAERVKILPVIPPVNYEYARKLFGEEFDRKYGDNVKKVQDLVDMHGARMLDMSYCLRADLFSIPTTVTETSNGTGREKVAGLLCAAIERMDDSGTGNPGYPV